MIYISLLLNTCRTPKATPSLHTSVCPSGDADKHLTGKLRVTILKHFLLSQSHNRIVESRPAVKSNLAHMKCEITHSVSQPLTDSLSHSLSLSPTLSLTHSATQIVHFSLRHAQPMCLG